jgi:hypothetical protein
LVQYDPPVRNAALGLAAVLAIVGFVWIGQGLGYIRGSFMTGDPRWLRTGVICVVLAAALAFWALRRRRGV